MYKKYDREIFDSLRKQHNIMVLVGNGFDLAILKKYKKGRMAGKSTSYNDFYDYITYYGLTDENNILYRKMTEEGGKVPQPENWSDFEHIIDGLVKDRAVGVAELEKCVDEFQGFFTRFLNEIVDADLLVDFSDDVQNKKLARQSVSKFLKDLDYFSEIRFPQNTGHYDLFNFLFVNFNYTSLLDNYLYMDKKQFDPHIHTTVDRNFSFFPDLGGMNTGTMWSTYYVSNIIHPHGVQDIPRSILFGIDIPQFDKGTSKEKRLVKSYWSRYDVNYGSYFKETELYIIFGLAISQTDGWWYDQIFDSILLNNSELIIYKFGKEEENLIKDLFINSCIRHSNASDNDKLRVKENIYVITFEKNDTYFLGLEEKNI